MVESNCPVCGIKHSTVRITFAHLMWKHPRDYLRLKHSISSTEDPVVLLCRKMKINKKKQNLTTSTNSDDNLVSSSTDILKKKINVTESEKRSSIIVSLYFSGNNLK